jgi:hypothetical protein
VVRQKIQGLSEGHSATGAWVGPFWQQGPHCGKRGVPHPHDLGDAGCLREASEPAIAWQDLPDRDESSKPYPVGAICQADVHFRIDGMGIDVPGFGPEIGRRDVDEG